MDAARLPFRFASASVSLQIVLFFSSVSGQDRESPLSIETEIAKITSLAESGHPDRAISSLNNLIRENQELDNLVLLRAMLHSQSKDYAAAKRDFSHFISVDQTEPLAYLGLAMCHIMAEDPYSAITNLTAAIKLDPECADAYSQRARAKQMLSQFSDALDDFSQAIKLCPEESLAYKGRAECWVKLGNAPAAIENYTMYVERELQDFDRNDFRTDD